jgi:hypothetical protein
MLIVLSEGSETILTTLIYHAWMMNFKKIYQALHTATGREEFSLEDFEATAAFLLKSKV